MALSYLDFQYLLAIISFVILRAFVLLDEFVIVDLPFRSVSLLDFLLAFTILAILSDFVYHVFHVGGSGPSSSESHDVDPDDIQYVPLSEYVDSLED
jgi:hypothetical protein